MSTSVCVVTPGIDGYSETFIRAHVERLPAKVRVLHGGHFPTRRDDGSLLHTPPSLAARIRNSLRVRLGLVSPEKRYREPVIDFLKQTGAQAVLAEYGPTGVAMLDSCREADIPLVVHFHGYDASRGDVLKENADGYQRLFNEAAAIVCVSRAMESRLVALGAPKAKTHYSPCGVDTGLFSTTRPEANPPHFVAVGRFVDKKAPDLTLHAFRRVLDEVPESQLTMIGEGPLLDVCRRLAVQLDMGHAVAFPGALRHEEVAAHMQRARAFVQHSITAGNGDSEGTPVAVLEASASALPVLSTRHAGIPDVVVHGETGLLVDEGDVAGMARYMLQVARDPEMAAQLGRAGRSRVEQEYTMDRSIERLWQIISNTIKQQ